MTGTAEGGISGSGATADGGGTPGLRCLTGGAIGALEQSAVHALQFGRVGGLLQPQAQKKLGKIGKGAWQWRSSVEFRARRACQHKVRETIPRRGRSWPRGYLRQVGAFLSEGLNWKGRIALVCRFRDVFAGGASRSM